MEILINIAILIAAFIGMEAVAWLTHKYVMHGLFWFLHQDHHQKESDGFLEKNDFFFLIFAIPGIICLAYGSFNANNIALFVGIGITLYGACYFLVHDVFIHQRFNLFRNSNHWYFKGIRRAHKIHHKHLTKENGECFGMLWVPFKYFLTQKKQSAS